MDRRLDKSTYKYRTDYILIIYERPRSASTSKGRRCEYLRPRLWDNLPKGQAKLQVARLQNLGSATEMFELMQGEIFPFIKNLQGEDGDTSFSRYMKEANFQINKPQTLQKVVTAIDQLPTEDNDIKGDIYEYLLSKLQTSGTNGQFRTPRHIIKMMVELVELNAEDVICEKTVA